MKLLVTIDDRLFTPDNMWKDFPEGVPTAVRNVVVNLIHWRADPWLETPVTVGEVP